MTTLNVQGKCIFNDVSATNLESATLTVTGQTNLNDVSATNIYLTGNLIGTLGVTGNATVGGTLDVTGNTTVGGVNIQDKDAFFHGSTSTNISIPVNSTLEWNQTVYGSTINSNGFIADRSGYYSITLNIFFTLYSTGQIRIGVKVDDSVFRSTETYIISSDSANADGNMFTGNMIVFLSAGQRLTTYVVVGTLRYYGQHSYISGFYIGSS